MNQRPQTPQKNAQRSPNRTAGTVSVPPRTVPRRQPPRTNYGKAFTALLITTVALLLVSVIVLGVALCVGDFSASPSGSGGGGGSDSGNQGGNNSSSGAVNMPNLPVSTRKQKTNMTLPSQTTGETSYSFAQVTDIEESLESQTAALLDVTHLRGVASKNGNQKMYPASMTKVMTLLVACENAADPTALLTVTDEIYNKYEAETKKPGGKPSLAYSFEKGNQYTVEDVLHMVIYQSDTIACWLLADHVAGSEEAFVAMMNRRAASLGIAATTHFENCTGLENENHYTTCFDMAIIMAAAMNNPAAELVLTSTQQYYVDIYKNEAKSGSFGMQTAWVVSRLEEYKFGKEAWYYAGNGSDVRLIAGKTGYETNAGYCFVTVGRNEETGTLYVCVQGGASSARQSTLDNKKIYQLYGTS